MEQPSFFDPPPGREIPVSVPYAKGSETSKAGAKRVESAAARMAQELLAAYRRLGPLTDQEAADALGWQRTTVIPRRHALMQAGLVIEVGTRKNPISKINNTTYSVK